MPEVSGISRCGDATSTSVSRVLTARMMRPDGLDALIGTDVYFRPRDARYRRSPAHRGGDDMEKPEEPPGQGPGADPNNPQGGGQGGNPDDPGFIQAGIGETVWRPHASGGGSGGGEAALAQKSAGTGIDPNPLSATEVRDLKSLLIHKYGNLEADVKWKEIMNLDYAAQRENLRILRNQYTGSH